MYAAVPKCGECSYRVCIYTRVDADVSAKEAHFLGCQYILHMISFQALQHCQPPDTLSLCLSDLDLSILSTILRTPYFAILAPYAENRVQTKHGLCPIFQRFCVRTPKL